MTGVVIGADGEPAPGARIQLFQRTMADGEPRLSSAPSTGQAMTDDHGMFRLFGIRPGAYAIAATPPNTVLGSAEIRQLSEQELRTAMAAAALLAKGPAGREWKNPCARGGSGACGAARWPPRGFLTCLLPGHARGGRGRHLHAAPGQEMRVSISLQLVPDRAHRGHGGDRRRPAGAD